MEADGLARGLFLLSIVLPGNTLKAKNKKMLQVIDWPFLFHFCLVIKLSVDSLCGMI